jgi:hypothetical protein
MKLWSMLSAASALAVCSPVFGAFTLQALPSTTAPAPGEAFTVDIVVTPGVGETRTFDAVVFTVEFNVAGLTYTSYAWNPAFSGIFDNSDPGLASLPLAITAGTFSDTLEIDVYFDNFASSALGSGTLVTLGLAVPEAMAPGTGIIITPVYDAFALGMSVIAPGDINAVAAHLTVVPEPAALGLLAVGSLALLRRRQ